MNFSPAKMKLLSLVLIIFIPILLFFAPLFAFASEGVIELRSTDGNDYRCYVSSILMTTGTYRISASCRDLLYSSDDALIFYVLWATPTKANSKPVRITDLGLGRVSVESRTVFSDMFVTVESRKTPTTPSVNIVMRGSVQPISFLESRSNTAPTSVVQQANNSQITETIAPSGSSASTREKIGVALQRAAIIAVGVVIIGGAIIFAITRAKG